MDRKIKFTSHLRWNPMMNFQKPMTVVKVNQINWRNSRRYRCPEIDENKEHEAKRKQIMMTMKRVSGLKCLEKSRRRNGNWLCPFLMLGLDT
ncbi:hypothetical protein NPIL_594951 [Nephila pilipes]|uniref:Uncharacterized protein n=1 Tax=Nephila pilipes TaxID=299642 RepID=A0A8X6U123_NEPPI|nr:hypothetical protein NPIL_594951 [Nephila pilipes]